MKKKRVRLDATLAELGIDDNKPALTRIEKQATVSDLLKARSGVYHSALYETTGMEATRPLRGSQQAAKSKRLIKMLMPLFNERGGAFRF